MSKKQCPPARYQPDWLASLDKRTAIAQTLANRHQQLCDDLGGLDQLSYQQKALIDRALFLEFHLQQEEAKLATGAEFDSGKWVQACNALNGLFSKLGLQRQAKVVPALETYIRGSK
ncbi:hypothetical protein [Microbulbifer magnicolonia]|uniref:hypothetical protein n=1 Tax=Microbulbifer magnicolonia TaxID=3109744 RepID=UPI002B402A98|nr:hypothetical protein [Microbulbifer sp. GG15]